MAPKGPPCHCCFFLFRYFFCQGFIYNCVSKDIIDLYLYLFKKYAIKFKFYSPDYYYLLIYTNQYFHLYGNICKKREFIFCTYTAGYGYNQS